MFESCLAGCTDYDSATVSETVIRKAAKEHVCEECRQAIQRGDRYEYHRSLFDGYWSTIKTCLPCRNVRRGLVRSGYLVSGELWQWVHEAYCGEDENGNEECVCP